MYDSTNGKISSNSLYYWSWFFPARLGPFNYSLVDLQLSRPFFWPADTQKTLKKMNSLVLFLSRIGFCSYKHFLLVFVLLVLFLVFLLNWDNFCTTPSWPYDCQELVLGQLRLNISYQAEFFGVDFISSHKLFWQLSSDFIEFCWFFFQSPTSKMLLKFH